MARLLADEHFPAKASNRLRRLGHDVLDVRQLCDDKSGDGISDEAVFRIAVEQKRAMVTQNIRHFRPLAQANPGHYGLFLCAAEFPDLEKAQKIDAALRNGEVRGHVVEIGADPPPARHPHARRGPKAAR